MIFMLQVFHQMKNKWKSWTKSRSWHFMIIRLKLCQTKKILLNYLGGGRFVLQVEQNCMCLIFIMKTKNSEQKMNWCIDKHACSWCLIDEMILFKKMHAYMRRVWWTCAFLHEKVVQKKIMPFCVFWMKTRLKSVPFCVFRSQNYVNFLPFRVFRC